MLFAPFLILYAILFFFALAFLFFLIEIHVINYAFQLLGLPPELAFFALLATLIGSYINIPITRIDGGNRRVPAVVSNFGIRYRLPTGYTDGSTIVAINVGGAVVPILISIYVLMHWPAIIPSALIATALVTLIVYRFARPVPGIGIA